MVFLSVIDVTSNFQVRRHHGIGGNLLIHSKFGIGCAEGTAEHFVVIKWNFSHDYKILHDFICGVFVAENLVSRVVIDLSIIVRWGILRCSWWLLHRGSSILICLLIGSLVRLDDIQKLMYWMCQGNNLITLCLLRPSTKELHFDSSSAAARTYFDDCSTQSSSVLLQLDDL